VTATAILIGEKNMDIGLVSGFANQKAREERRKKREA